VVLGEGIVEIDCDLAFVYGVEADLPVADHKTEYWGMGGFVGIDAEPALGLVVAMDQEAADSEDSQGMGAVDGKA
jgi:hypothetical protein